MPSDRVLITGGAGFLGGHLTERFRSEGVPVRLFDMAEPPGWACEPGIEYLQGDIRDPGALAAALEDVGSVVHAAFAPPRQSGALIRSVNVDGTRNLCAQALSRGVRRFILISSTIVQKPPRAHPFLQDSPLTRLDEYRAARLAAEECALSYSEHGLSVAIVRPKTFLGPGVGAPPGRGGPAFALLFERIRQGRPVPVLGSGRSRYQLLHIRDMADGICRLAATDAGGIFFFGAREFRTVREDLQALLDHAASGSRLQFIPAGAARIALRGIELAGFDPLSEWHHKSAYGEDSVVDLSRAETELDWQPQWSNAEALIEAYDWHVASAAAAGAARSTHPVPRLHRALSGLNRFLPW